MTSVKNEAGISELKQRSEAFLDEAIITGQHLHMHNPSVGYAAAETPGGLLIEKLAGCTVLTAEDAIARDGLVSHVFFGRGADFEPEAYEATDGDEGWGRPVAGRDLEAVASRLLDLLP